jgi:hypothetical protein
MRALSVPFCAVCRQVIRNRIGPLMGAPPAGPPRLRTTMLGARRPSVTRRRTGPRGTTSTVGDKIMKRALRGKRARRLGSLDQPHTLN